MSITVAGFDIVINFFDMIQDMSFEFAMIGFGLMCVVGSVYLMLWVGGLIREGSEFTQKAD